MAASMPTLAERLPELARQLAETGSLGIVVIDAPSFAKVEDDYGVQAFDEVRGRLVAILSEHRGRDWREDDVPALVHPRATRVVLCLARKRRPKHATTLADVRVVRNRLRESLAPNLGRAAFPYLKSARVDIGYSVAVDNPLVHPERVLERAIEDSVAMAAHDRRTEDLEVRERLLDILLRERLVTAFQPILRLKDRTAHAFEALTRGPRGSGLEGADALFGAAEEHGLVIELDRLCRKRALLSAGRLPTNAKIFVNTLPATIRDPQFRGRALIDFLQKAQVSPERIVIEITEKLVIENYGLFREAMSYFTALGVTFAVDDVGSGYSGLEAIARLKPAYLKIDIGLIRDVHVSAANREIVRGITMLGHGIGAMVIAEGIQAPEEAEAVMEMGVEFGQGFHLARPDPGPEPAA